MLTKFYEDRYFLLRYYLQNFAFYVLVASLLIQVAPVVHDPLRLAYFLLLFLLISPSFSVMVAASLALIGLTMWHYGAAITYWHWLLIPFGIYTGMFSATCMHNAAHGNFRPRRLNRIIGELCGVQQLLGFKGWMLTHMIHHKYPDDPTRDPHPPQNLTFWQFLNQMKMAMQKCMTRNYMDVWGDNSTTRKYWKITETFLIVNRLLRACIWILLLGPVGFAFFFAPSLIANVLFYTHFNYYTHRPKGDGSFEILNLNHNLGYKVLNALFFGAYFHHNHHLKPRLFNPMYFSSKAMPVSTSIAAYPKVAI